VCRAASDERLHEPPETAKLANCGGKYPVSFRECLVWPWLQTDKSGDVRTKPLTNPLTKASTAEKMTPLKPTKEDKESNKKKNNNLENQEGKKKEPAKVTLPRGEF
jgi:hypothetical protein